MQTPGNTADKVTTVTPKEGLEIVLNRPYIDVEAQNEDYALELGIDETRMRVQFALQSASQNKAEIIYENHTVLTRQTIEEALLGHQNLLELLRQCKEKSLSKSIVAAKREHELREFYLFVEPEMRRLIIRIIMIFVNIWDFMNFRSPLTKQDLMQSFTDKTVMVAIMGRFYVEIRKQACAYEAAAKGTSNTSLNELVMTMKEIVYVLGEIVTRDQNTLRAETRVIGIGE